MEYIKKFIIQAKDVLDEIDIKIIEDAIKILIDVKRNDGRIYFIGSGGGAGNASHATCDFRKIGGFEAYCITDNVSDLTARINDEGWDTSISNSLMINKLKKNDCLFIFSVGGGNEEKKISVNIVNAIKLAKEKEVKIISVIGKNDGYAAKYSDVPIIIPISNTSFLTPLTESFQVFIWHLIVSHPKITQYQMKWESLL